MLFYITVIILLIALNSAARKTPAPSMIDDGINYNLRNGLSDESDTDGPLMLTPYIQAGHISQAKSLSLVGPINGFDSMVSYSGYLTVDPAYNSNLFFWYFEALSNHETAPVILWLQGGPGGSDMFGLFVEIGPYSINSQLQLVPNRYTWITSYNVLFIDSPVGTGFSFTDSDKGFARNEEDVSTNLDNALRQFFSMFPEYIDNEFFITGESYAGKYIPSLGYRIHFNNPAADVKINLKGVAIGNAFIDPLSQNNYARYLYNLGMIDYNQLIAMEKWQNSMSTYIKAGKWTAAFEILDELLLGVLYPYPTYINNVTGVQNIYNYLKTAYDVYYYPQYLQRTDVRRAIHVGDLTYHDGAKVINYMYPDVTNSTKPQLEFLLDNNYQVMLYNGQLDICVAYPLTVNMLESMTWRTSYDYRAAPRIIWKVDEEDVEVAGYARPSHNLVEVMVRNAGHLVPMDQPRVALDLIRRFIQGKPWLS